jgi:hypothetical protein
VHKIDAVRDEITTGKRVLHAVVALALPVRDHRRAKRKRFPRQLLNLCVQDVSELAKVQVAWLGEPQNSNVCSASVYPCRTLILQVIMRMMQASVYPCRTLILQVIMRMMQASVYPCRTLILQVIMRMIKRQCIHVVHPKIHALVQVICAREKTQCIEQ